MYGGKVGKSKLKRREPRELDVGRGKSNRASAAGEHEVMTVDDFIEAILRSSAGSKTGFWDVAANASLY